MNDQVSKALAQLGECVVLAEAIGQSFGSVAGDGDRPDWVYVYQRQVAAISDAFQEVERTLYQGVGGGGAGRAFSVVDK